MWFIHVCMYSSILLLCKTTENEHKSNMKPVQNHTHINFYCRIKIFARIIFSRIALIFSRNSKFMTRTLSINHRVVLTFCKEFIVTKFRENKTLEKNSKFTVYMSYMYPCSSWLTFVVIFFHKMSSQRRRQNAEKVTHTKGDYWIKQWFSWIVPLFKWEPLFKERICSQRERILSFISSSL